MLQAKSGDHILIMSNGGFDNIHERLLITLKSKIIDRRRSVDRVSEA
ncbi:hypothetical protein BGP_5485 [Beggiatoa sp. PS]|nr:hypothetical protein BGP_5485 [Beggiatoa sp. PS]